MCRAGGPRCQGNGRRTSAATATKTVTAVIDPPSARATPRPSSNIPTREDADRLAAALPTSRTGWDGSPLSEKDRRFYALRESGYQGPIDQDGYPVSSMTPGTPAVSEQARTRVVDRDGFVVDTDRVTGVGGRPSVGGLSSVVQQGDRVGVIVGLDNTDDDGALKLHLVWLPDGNTSQGARNRAMAAYQRGDTDAEQVRAEGLVALDAYLPDDE